MNSNKMYDSYLKFIGLAKKKGVKITKAYFTTFILDLPFFERFLIHPLIDGLDKPRNVRDFEEINDFLAESLDLRVYCDLRGIDNSQPKKTSFGLYGINVKSLEDTKFQNGVFHPKVILLINEINEVFLWASSANITISGWGKNLESFTYKNVQSEDNLTLIFELFNRIDKSIEYLTSNRLEGKKEDWQFHSNFRGSLLEDFKIQDSNLSVVSPYFSNRMEELIKILKNKFNYKSLQIIPDIQNHKIRMKGEDIKYFRNISNSQTNIKISNFKSSVFNEEENRFRHSKMWITNNQVAVGSWNFTKSALFLNEDKNNIEAGIIINNSPENISEKLFTYMSEEELQNISTNDNNMDGEDSTIFNLDLPDINLHIHLDWKIRSAKLLCDAEKEFHGNDINIKFPFENKYIEATIGQDFDLISIPEKMLLSFKTFIFQINGNEFIGLVREINLKERPGKEFESLQDIFNFAWEEDTNFSHKTISPKNKSEDIEDYEEFSNIENSNSSNDISYFKLFIGFKNLNAHLENLKEQKQSDRIMRYLWSLPGNINELDQKIKIFLNNPNYSDTYKYIFYLEYKKYLINGMNLIKGSTTKLDIEYSIKKINPIIESVNSFISQKEKVLNINDIKNRSYKKILEEFYKI